MRMLEQPRSELELSRLVDAEFVRVAREGSASALRLIVRRHNQRLYRVARAIVRDDTEAEDVLQEAYLSAFRSLAKFRADASLSTWLTRIVVNKAVDHLGREGVTVPLDTVDKTEQLQTEMIGMPHLDIDPERLAARSQVRDLLERAIDNLPASFRVVIISGHSRRHRENASLPRQKLMREQLQAKLASALTDTFTFQDPRCAEFTSALLARLAQNGEPGGPSRQHP